MLSKPLILHDLFPFRRRLSREKRNVRTTLCRWLPSLPQGGQNSYRSTGRSKLKALRQSKTNQQLPRRSYPCRQKRTREVGVETAELPPYFRGCSFDSTLCPGAGTAVPKVRNTLRSTMPEMMRTIPTRKRPMVSGRLDSDVRIICTTR